MNKSRRIRWAGYAKCVGEKRGTYRVLVAKPESTKPLGNTRCRRENVLKWVFKGSSWFGGLDLYGSG
jgi:hypothetical protein